MSKAIIEELSEKERACLAHDRQAQAQGMSFAEYCRARDLKVNQWYWVRSGLIRKGVIAAAAVAAPAPIDPPSGFVPIQITPPILSETSACRLRHPSGWVIECDRFPDAQWLLEVMSRVAR